MEDLKIIEQCQKGDLSGFSKIYEKYIDKIYKFIYLKTSSKEVAEDITSDVFLSAVNKIGSFEIQENASIQSWLYRIAGNKVIDFYRTNKQTEEVGDYLDMSIHEDMAQQVDNSDKLSEVLEFITTLKDDQRQIMLLRIWDDLSYKEIADITGKSVDSCKKIVSRTLKTISETCLLIILILIVL